MGEVLSLTRILLLVLFFSFMRIEVFLLSTENVGNGFAHPLQCFFSRCCLCSEYVVVLPYPYLYPNMNINIICIRHVIQIQIWILFLTPWVRNMNKNIICKEIFTNIFKYVQIFEIKQIPGYCYRPVWRLCIRYQNIFVTFHTAG